ncbi:MAG TPA: TonB family protein [Candidatus Sulfotelmatobacter sp.]|jgi:TonB family protein
MSRPDTWKNWEGRTVDGRFPLRQWLGNSEHSAVFLTERPGQASQKAAIKFVELNGGDPEREASRLRAAANLSHPNLIRILANGRCQVDGTPFLYAVMEYAEEDLAQILPQRALSAAEVGDMLPPLLDALSYIHDKGFVHGHIKPSNVQAVQDQLKLSSDQVIAAAEPNLARKRMGVFDAPETATGTISAAADVWSLGVTIVDALTQNLPSQGQTDPGVPKDIPEPYRGIVRDCLHLDPAMRCSVSDIRARLKPGAASAAARESIAESKYRPESVSEPEPAGKGKMLGIGAILVIVAAMVVWGLWPKAKPQPAAAPAATEQPAAPPAPSTGKTMPPAGAAGAGGAVRHQSLPDIPTSAMRTISGTIKISIHVDVDASGKVTNAKLKSSGPSRYFSGRALKAAQEWEFSPPEVNGQPVASAWLIQFHLRRSGVQASSERVTR